MHGLTIPSEYVATSSGKNDPLQSSRASAENSPPAAQHLQRLTQPAFIAHLPQALIVDLSVGPTSSDINNLARTSKAIYLKMQQCVRMRLLSDNLQQMNTPLLAYKTASNRKEQYLTDDLPGIRYLKELGLHHKHLQRQIKKQQCTVSQALQTKEISRKLLADRMAIDPMLFFVLKQIHYSELPIHHIESGLLSVKDILNMTTTGFQALMWNGVEYYLGTGLLTPPELNNVSEWSARLLDVAAIQSAIFRDEISVQDVIAAKDPIERLHLDPSDRFGAQKYLFRWWLTLAQCNGLNKDDCLDLNLDVVQQYLDTGKMTMTEMLALSPEERRALPPLVLSVDR